MIARLQRFVTLGLLAFVSGWAALAIVLGHGRWAWGGAALVVGGYLLIMAFEMVLAAWVHGDDPAPRPTFGQRLRAWFGEVTTSPRVFCWSQPFRSTVQPDWLPADAAARGVVLVHGFVCNRGFWNDWMPRLAARGIPHVAVDLEPAFCPITTYAEVVGAAVRRVHAATGHEPVIVAHSMGGLAVRAWLASGGRGVHRVITIASPHHGTWAARFSATDNAGDMRQDSGLLGLLAAAETPELLARFTCFYSHCDNIVFPPSTATLDGADNRHVPAMAHVHLAGHPAVFEETVRWARDGLGS